MPFGLIAVLAAGVFAVAVSEKGRAEVQKVNQRSGQPMTTKSEDGTYRDSYGNAYQRLEDGSLVAIPNYRF